jgi:hypothetical protein
MTVTATKIDSSQEGGNDFITWAWPAATTIIYNNPVALRHLLYVNFLTKK